MKFGNTEDELQAWENYIGKFVIAFGEIERSTYELLLTLPTEDLSEIFRNMPLAARIDFVAELLPQRVPDLHLVNELCERLAQAKARIKDRNTIAHNPVSLSLFNANSGIDTRRVVSKFHPDFEAMRKTEIDIYQLIDMCTEVESLASSISQLQVRVEELLWFAK